MNSLDTIDVAFTDLVNAISEAQDDADGSDAPKAAAKLEGFLARVEAVRGDFQAWVEERERDR
ncbi:MAG TPA: hypothetical protein VFN64_09590 [Burkholderiaceae bacterium]|nr:hypothetical protein [Burkholderiaceae bacterium]